MTDTPTGADPTDAPSGTPGTPTVPGGAATMTDAESARAEASRRWRSVWRLHFYAGMVAMPFILLMAITGLVILYTQPIEDATQGDLRTVSPGAEMLSFDEQAALVATAHPDATVLDLTPPADEGRATRFYVDDGSANGLHVFIDPFTGEVLGDVVPGSGVVGLSNRLHGHLNNDTSTIRLPTVSALWDDGPVMREYVIGDLLLEVLGVWTLVLVVSGLYLWWPRRSAQGTGSRGARRVLGIRRGVSGRARWRDLHGIGGLTMSVVLVITLVSGLAWSTYWGPQFSSLADELTPGSAVEAPASSLGVRGDLDRFGNQIPWATGDFPIPASYAPPPGADLPAPLTLDAVVEIAQVEGMRPGYTISFPGNDVDEAGNPVYGAFTLYNSWPRRTEEARDVFIDQFSGTTLAEQSVYGYGAVARGMDTLVSTHMGTQFGLVSRVLMTAMCLLAIWAVVSGFAMFWRRRRPGTAGLPRRPVDVRLSRRVAAIGVVFAIVYPHWAVTALAVLALDRFVIRRIGVLRRAFGQPPAAPA